MGGKKQLDDKQMKIQKALDLDKEVSLSYQKFRQSIKTPATQRAYNNGLDKFMIQSNLKKYDSVLKLDTNEIQHLLEQYVISIKNLSHSTVNQYLSGVELFLDMNRLVYFKRILRKMLPSNDKIQGGKMPYTTEEIQRMLSVTVKLRSKAIIHYFASTGSRPASIEDPILRMKHIEDMPHGCKSVLIYDGSKQGYYAFLTNEASKALNNYLNQRTRHGEILTPESPVFSNTSRYQTTKQDYLSQSSARQIIRDASTKAGIERTKTGKRYDKAEFYGFRKRFNGILKMNNDVNSNIAEKLMAHKRGLDGVYLQPTREECFTEFYKAIQELTIDPTHRQKIKIEELQEEKTELELKNQRIEELEKRFEKEIKADEKFRQERDLFLERLKTPEGRKLIGEEFKKMMNQPKDLRYDIEYILKHPQPKNPIFDLDNLIKKKSKTISK